MLCALVEKRPNVVPKADLFGQIWPDVFVVEGNLNVLVGEIRRALGDDPQEPRFIRTVHGVGYAFCAKASTLDRGAAADGPPARFWLTWKSQTFARRGRRQRSSGGIRGRRSGSITRVCRAVMRTSALATAPSGRS